VQTDRFWLVTHQLVQKYEKRDMPHLDWLDKMTFAEIEKIHAVSRRQFQHLAYIPSLTARLSISTMLQAESAKSPHLFLYIDLLKFDFPVVFAEPVRVELARIEARHTR
jgi:phosphatidylinositol 3-kinase